MGYGMDCFGEISVYSGSEANTNLSELGCWK